MQDLGTRFHTGRAASDLLTLASKFWCVEVKLYVKKNKTKMVWSSLWQHIKILMLRHLCKNLY